MMKLTFVLSILILYFSATNSFAQMGHGMMRESPGGMMHEHMMDHMGMMDHEQMTGSMTDMMSQLSSLMDRMSEMMKDMPKEKMHQMSSLMRDMCSEMDKMSGMMDADTVSEEEIKALQHRTLDLQKRVLEITQ